MSTIACKSPFLVFEEFMSPQRCEDLVDGCNFSEVPDYGSTGKPLKMVKQNDYVDQSMYARLQPCIPQIEQYYSIQYHGTERTQVEWIPAGCIPSVSCENSEFVNGKWVRTKRRDLTAILFLSDFNSSPPFDTEFEVYGGKLEFPQHKFGFNPQRGTLIVFPSDPHFLNAASAVSIGNAFQARLHIASQTPMLYDPAQYPGNYTQWFK